MDAITQQWMRNASDERAVANGCRFDVERTAYVVWWIERYCKLYEGSDGDPLILRGCHDCYEPPPDFSEWNDDARATAMERAAKHCECHASGHRLDWQYECVMRLFGWVKWSDKWQRDIRRFREASVWIGKKNKKSPSLAAIGLYLLIADDEHGQKVFLGAKDGKQAREIAGRHVLEMVRSSPELDAECTINLNLSRITHEETRSILQPLSSSNARTKESKEGLNGSVLIDETHVVDRDFIDRISRAGISRSEPLHAEFSTAGDNQDGYGKSRFDYAQQVERGEREDEGLFVAIYAAPQDVSDADLAADPLKYARMANPALGHTVDEAELLNDFRKSLAGTIDQFAKCKMYRFNIWQQASNPWLKQEDWRRCGEEYTEEDLLGRECFGGLDLSLRWDTTAFVLVFPWGDDEAGNPTWRLWPMFFLPRDSAERTRSKVPWFDWDRDGHLILTDGNGTDFRYVRQCINEAAKKFQIVALGYDKTYAASFAQDLQDEDGISVVNFPQKPGEFLEPLGVFEGAVQSGRIRHPGNRVLNWQARHVQKGRSGMLEKPAEKSEKKIDGVVAAVMGLGVALASESKTEEWYTPGCLRD